jgi:hypothetical protein
MSFFDPKYSSALHTNGANHWKLDGKNEECPSLFIDGVNHQESFILHCHGTNYIIKLGARPLDQCKHTQ